jgi:DNA-binding protein H-NS
MNIKEKNLNNYTNKFDKLVSEEKLNINSLENLMVSNIEEYTKDLKQYTEELLSSHINEKELISKKNKNGKKKDLS